MEKKESQDYAKVRSSPDILDYQENGTKNTDVASSMKISNVGYRNYTHDSLVIAY